MKKKYLQAIDREISGLILGTMYLYNGSEEDGFRYLDTAVENGITIFDSAQSYGDSEVVLGKWMEARDNRSEVVIITKGCHPNRFRGRVTDYDLQSDLMDSLSKLRTDYIDIYLIHKDDPGYPVGKLMRVLDEQYRAGRIRAYGVSNWSHERIEEANAYAREHGLHELDISSPSFSLADYQMEPWGPGNVSIAGKKNKAARDWYRRSQMPVFAFSSLARGFFSGRISRELYEAQKNEEHNPMKLFLGQASKAELSGTTDQIDPICFHSFCFEDNFKRLDRCRELAAQKGYTVAQIALAYILNTGINVFPIIGAANAEEINSAAAALEIRLTEEETAYLNLES